MRKTTRKNSHDIRNLNPGPPDYEVGLEGIDWINMALDRSSGKVFWGEKEKIMQFLFSAELEQLGDHQFHKKDCAPLSSSPSRGLF